MPVCVPVYGSGAGSLCRPMRLLVRFALIIGVASVLLAVGLRGMAVPYQRLGDGLWTASSSRLGEFTQLNEPSVVYDRNGNVLTLLKAEENRNPVALPDVPPIVVQAILDVEDENFYGHSGFDVRSAARAFFANAGAGSIRQGGSTITQQLVKKTLLSDERSLDRKLKEAVLATRLEDQLTKEQILERYLNLVYFGNGAYGVQAAAEAYFAVPLSQVTPGQAALLAGLIRNPLANDPFRNPDQAKDRRATALDQMVKNGHLAAEEAERLKEEPLPAQPNKPIERQSYFIEALKQRLLSDTRLGDTPPDRYDAIFRGGLQIHTTFDPRAQQLAEAATSVGVPPIGSRTNRIGATSALVTLDAPTGAVRAVVGGPGFSEENKFDIATQGYRQPGSTFKLFTLLAALEAGYGPGSQVDGSGPCLVNTALGAPKNRRPRPLTQEEIDANTINNAGDGIGGGVMTMAAATSGSVNCAYERMAATIGFSKVVEVAKRLGLGRNPRYAIEEVATMPIGVEEATPLEMAAAYAAVANDGIYHEPSFLDRVVDRKGKVLFRGFAEGKRVLSPVVARTVSEIMGGVFSGTAACCRLASGAPAAGKTGTTDESKNTWFIGYTPTTVTAVWVGVPRGNVSMRGLGDRAVVYGSTFAAPIWKSFMDPFLEGQPTPPFPAVTPTQAIPSKPFVLPPDAIILPGTAMPATSPITFPTTRPGATSAITFPTTRRGTTGRTPPTTQAPRRTPARPGATTAVRPRSTPTTRAQ